MTQHEWAVTFVEKYENEIKKQLGIITFDKKAAIECVSDFIGREKTALDKNPDNINAFSSNQGMVADIIGSMYNTLVPEKIRKLHEAQAKVEGKKLGKVLTGIVRMAAAHHTKQVVGDR